MTNKPHRFALLIDWVTSPFHAAVCDAAVDFYKQYSISIDILVCGRFGTQDYDTCRNHIFSLVNKNFYDGILVCASSIQGVSDGAIFLKFLENYRPIPMVTLYESYTSFPSVLLDNKRGIQILLESFIAKNISEEIVFVSGLLGNRDARERLESFIEFSEVFKLQYKITDGDFRMHSGQKAFIDHPEHRVFFCANDAMAMGVLEESHKMKKDVYVFGFDGDELIDSNFFETIANPIKDIVFTGFRKLISINTSKKFEYNTKIEPNLRDKKGKIKSSISEFELEEFNIIAQDLFTKIGTPENLSTAKNSLPRLGIESCTLIAYSESQFPLRREVQAKIILNFGDKIIPNHDEYFTVFDLIPINSKVQNGVNLVQSLFRGNEIFGHAIFSIGTQKWRIYEMLRKEFATVLQAQNLISELRNYSENLELIVEERTKELIKRENHLRDIAEFLPNAIFELDDENILTFCNVSGKQLIGYILEVNKRVNILELIIPEDRDVVEDGFSTIRSTKTLKTIELRIFGSKKNEIHHLVCEASPIFLENEKYGLRLSAMNIAHLFSSLTEPEQQFYEHYKISNRKREVLELLIKGFSIKDISETLSISLNTAKVHIHKLYKDLGVKKREGLFKILREYQSQQFGNKSYVLSLFNHMLKK